MFLEEEDDIIEYFNNHLTNGLCRGKDIYFQVGRVFLFGGLSTPNKKVISLGPSRLCGEDFILGQIGLK